MTLSISGLPRLVTAKFSPSSIVNSGSSMLTVSAKKNAPSGTFTLTIAGTSGAVVAYSDGIPDDSVAP